MNIDIYIPPESTNVFSFHLNQLASRTFDNWTFYNNIEVFKTAGNHRIACFQLPYPWDPKIENQINEIYDQVDDILIIGSELHARTVDFIQRFDRSKITYFICGYLHFRMANSRVNKFLDWFTTSIYFYKHVRPSTLFDLNPGAIKPLMFDALLGRKKPHRDLAFNYIQNNNLASQGIVTYVNDHEINFDASNTSRWQWQSEGITNFDEKVSEVKYTVDRVDYYGYNISISQIIPIDIYNQTAYSLVCETNTENTHVFYTEKTIKPILARRLFITLGNKHHLAGLHRLGFKTFGDIIDESYDNIDDPTERHTAAMNQLQWLCGQDQADILHRCQDIVDYNFNLMYSNDWYNLFRMDFGDFFFSKHNRVL